MKSNKSLEATHIIKILHFLYIYTSIKLGCIIIMYIASKLTPYLNKKRYVFYCYTHKDIEILLLLYVIIKKIALHI